MDWIGDGRDSTFRFLQRNIIAWFVGHGPFLVECARQFLVTTSEDMRGRISSERAYLQTSLQTIKDLFVVRVDLNVFDLFVLDRVDGNEARRRRRGCWNFLDGKSLANVVG